MNNKIAFVISILITVSAFLYLENRNYVLDYLNTNIKEYQQQELNTEEKILSLYYLESLNDKNKDKVMEHVNKYYSDMDIRNISDNTLKKFLSECRAYKNTQE